VRTVRQARGEGKSRRAVKEVQSTCNYREGNKNERGGEKTLDIKEEKRLSSPSLLQGEVEM